MPRTTKKAPAKRPAKKPDQNLHELLIVKMQSLLDTENQLVKALPKMAKNASNPDLKSGFQKHLKETQEHVRRLERAFKKLEVKPKKLTGEAIRGIVADAEWIIQNVRGDEAMDVNLIAAGQYAEHYEIAGYGAAIAWAKLMGHDEVVDLLTQTIEEEKQTDKDLSALATSGGINQQALPA